MSNGSFGFLVIEGGIHGKIIPIQDGDNLVGRWDPDASAFPEIDLTEHDTESKVSRKHAVIDWNGTQITLTDAGSRNGTFLSSGKQLASGESVTLVEGDEVIFAKIRVRVVRI